MPAEKLRDQDTKELEGQAREMTEQLFHLKFQISMGQTDGLKKYRAVKKDRARVLTLLREREIAARAAGGEETS